jgi:hypothetical protein
LDEKIVLQMALLPCPLIVAVFPLASNRVRADGHCFLAEHGGVFIPTGVADGATG